MSAEGWQRLKSAQRAAEVENNLGVAYTLEDLNELTGLSSHTLTKVRRQQNPVDKQTLEAFFKAFGLTLTPRDYIKPFSTIISETETTPPKNLASASPEQSTPSLALSAEPSFPQGQVPLGSIFYVERLPMESTYCKSILHPGTLIRIKAPRRMGKTSAMVRILDYAARQGCQTVFLNLQLAERDILQNLDRFLQWFSASVGLGMQLPNQLANYWDELFGCKISCKIYFEQYLLAKSSQPLVLALDDVDRLFDYPELADEFFGLLRAWHEQAKNRGIWQQLRLIVAHSTKVYIPLNFNKSPFNVGLPIELKPFTTEQVKYLGQQYSLNLSPEQVEQLMAISCGHPYLIQLGLYSLWQENLDIKELSQQALMGTGIYAEHLQRLLWTLEQDPSLAFAFTQVLQASSPVRVRTISGV